MSALGTGAGVDLPAVLSLTEQVPQLADTVGAVLRLPGFVVSSLGHLTSHFSPYNTLSCSTDWTCGTGLGAELRIATRFEIGS